jgi:hypothetical protein
LPFQSTRTIPHIKYLPPKTLDEAWAIEEKKPLSLLAKIAEREHIQTMHETLFPELLSIYHKLLLL